MESTQVVIIGGGITGAGILWDLSLRGISAVLFEKQDLANGATGRCHGLLHSGCRYVIKDSDAAKECAIESKIIKKIAPNCVQNTGGFFIQCSQDDPTFFTKWEESCKNIDIVSERLSVDEVLAMEPNLTTNILGAFTCSDSYVDVFQLVKSNIGSAVMRGANFRSYCEVTAINSDGGRVRYVDYINNLTGESGAIACDIVVNASGGWAQKIAAMVGVNVSMRCDKGSLIVFNHSLVNHVINRCRMPGDADIIVPAGPVCILGTSSIVVPNPENLTVDFNEIQHLLNIGIELVPKITDARILRIFSGARPLYTPKNITTAAGREISRGFALLDHKVHDQISGFISIVGGKLTTYRLMAEMTSDLIASKLGNDRPCMTKEVPLRVATDERVMKRACQLLPIHIATTIERRLGSDLAHVVNTIETKPETAEVICECEQITLAEIDVILKNKTSIPVNTISDIGRRTRLGFGPCQGTFCGYKAMLAGYKNKRWTAKQASEEFERFLNERRKGQYVVSQGKQIEQLFLSNYLFGMAYNFYNQKKG